jgi:predicted AlkP superfamily phosphohydrolase/phosphomutase
MIREACKRYKLPGFERFLTKGKLTTMNSTLPPVSAAAWTSIYTGQSPGEHGVMEYLILDNAYNKLILEDIKIDPFWNVLARRGIKSLIVTPVMITSLDDAEKKVDLVTGFPLSPKYNNAGVEKKGKSVGFRGEPNIEAQIKDGSIRIEEAALRYQDSVEKRIKLIKDAMASTRYDLLFVCFTETDRLQHYSFGRGTEKLLEFNKDILEKISSFIEYLATTDPTTPILLISDHGAQQLKQKFLLNKWLIDNGYATLKKIPKAEKAKEGTSLKYKIRSRLAGTGWAEAILRTMPSSIKLMISKSMDVGQVDEGEGYIRIHDLNFDNFDMPKTRAFASISSNPVGMIWLNDGRFLDASVDSDKHSLKKEIMDKIAKVEVVEKVYDGDAYYKKTEKFIAPDILIKLKDGYNIDSFHYHASNLLMPVKDMLSGDHSENAMFGVLGKIVVPKKQMSVEDVAPIILSYFKV